MSSLSFGGPTGPGSSCNFCFALLGEILMTLPCLVSPAWLFSSKAHEGQTWFIFFLPSFMRGNSSGVPPCPPGGYSSPCVSTHILSWRTLTLPPTGRKPGDGSLEQHRARWEGPGAAQLGNSWVGTAVWLESGLFPQGVQLLRPVGGKREFWVLPANS